MLIRKLRLRKCHSEALWKFNIIEKEGITKKVQALDGCPPCFKRLKHGLKRAVFHS